MFQKVKGLFLNLTIYGIGDVAIQIVNFLLLPLYVRYLSPSDYGVIALLVTLEALTKVVYRWGLDASFMRMYFDCSDQRARQRLASTLFFFLLAVNGTLVVIALAASPWLARHLFGTAGYELPLQILLVNTFIGGFYFIPFHVLRINKQAGRFVALTFAQNASTVILRLAFVILWQKGVLGVLLADLIVTVGIVCALLPMFAPLIRLTCAPNVLREALRFGLPRVPHGAAHQVIAVSDRYILSLFASLRDVGVYGLGASFAMGMKLFLSAFENAWAPFYFGTMKDPNAKQTFSAITTYALAILVLLTAGLCAVSRDLVRVMTTPEFYGAADVIPWLALGVSFMGVYLLTSIGLNITKHTEYYPVATGISAACNVGLNLLLIPRFGILGAAWANMVAYAVLAATSTIFAQRVYPMRYETGRIARLVCAGLVAYLIARFELSTSVAPLTGFLVRGTTVVVSYLVLLWLLGFFQDRETARIRALFDRFRARRRAQPAETAADQTIEMAGTLVAPNVPGGEADNALLDHSGRPDSEWSRPAIDRAPARAALVLLAIVAVGTALRISGLAFGLPAVYNPDEVSIMSRALAFATGDLNPHNFLYPTLYFYVLFGWIGGWFVLGRLLGVFQSLGAFQQQFFTDPSTIYLAGRALGVVCGVLTIVLTYRLARRWWGRAEGLAAAAFLATAPFHVRDSHYVKHDVPVTLAVVAASLAISRIWKGDGAETGSATTWRTSCLAGVACGLAFSTHYYTIFLALPLTLAILFRHQRDGAAAILRHLGLAGAASAATFFACSPFILAEPATAIRDIVANRQIVMDRAVAMGGPAFASARAYVSMLWQDAIGWPVIVLAAAGAVFMARHTPTRLAVLMAFPVAFLMFISYTVPASRYLNPVLPFVAMLAAYGVTQLVELVSKRETGAVWKPALMTSVLVSLATIPGLSDSVRSDRFFRRTDTRTLALSYIETQVPAGTTILVQPYSVPLAQSTESLREALTQHLGDVDRATVKFQLRLAAGNPRDRSYRIIFLGDGGLDVDKIYVSYREVGGAQGLEALRNLRVAYVILTRYNMPDPRTIPFLEALEREGRRIAVFSPYRSDRGPDVSSRIEPYLHNTDARIDGALERPGPVIELWRLN